MELRYRGNTYYLAENALGKDSSIDLSHFSINLQPTLYRYRGIFYLKSLK